MLVCPTVYIGLSDCLYDGLSDCLCIGLSDRLYVGLSDCSFLCCSLFRQYALLCMFALCTCLCCQHVVLTTHVSTCV